MYRLLASVHRPRMDAPPTIRYFGKADNPKGRRHLSIQLGQELGQRVW